MSDIAAPSPFDILAARLGRTSGPELTLSGEDLDCPELTTALDAAGLGTLDLTETDIRTASGRVVVTGKVVMFGVDGGTCVVDFVETDGEVTVEVRASASDAARIELGSPEWAALGNVRLTSSAQGADLPVPLAEVEFAATAMLGGTPIDVTVRPSGTDWELSAAGIALPDLSALAAAVGLGNDTGGLPQVLPDLTAGRLALSSRISGQDWEILAVAGTLDFPGHDWELITGLPKLRDVVATVAVSFAGADPSEPDDLDDPRDASTTVTAAFRATIAFSGGLELPVSVSVDVDAYRIGIHGAHGFPNVHDLVREIAGDSAADILPSALGSLRMDAASVDVVLDRADATLRSVDVGLRLADHWPLIDGHLSLDRVALAITADRLGGSTSGFVEGVIVIEGFELPVSVVKEPGGAWTLTLGAAAGRRLADPASLNGLLGGEHLAEHLPGDIGGVSIDDLTVTFGGPDGTLSSVVLALSADGPWRVADLDGFDAHDLRVALTVTNPTDSATRTITGSLSGVIDLGGPTLKLSASKASATAEWQVDGDLAVGPALTLGALGSRTAPGGGSLPAGIPGGAQVDIAFTATPATGHFAVRASSKARWQLPTGSGRLAVSGVTLDVTRTDAPMSVVVGGELDISGTPVRVRCVIGPEVEVVAHVDNLRIGALADALLGDGTAGTLALPNAVDRFELSSLDLAVSPTAGSVSATAVLAGFEAVHVEVASGPDGWVFCGVLAPSNSWRLSSLSDLFEPFDDISFEHCLLVVSTGAVPASVAALPVVQSRLSGSTIALGSGVTFIASLDLRATKLDKVVGREQVWVEATMAADLSSFSLEAEVGGPFGLGGGIVLTSARLGIKVGSAGVEAALAGTVLIQLEHSTLVLKGGVSVTPNGFECFATLVGSWDEPFGAKGFKITGLALVMGMSWELVPTVGILGKFEIGGFGGDVELLFRGDDPAQSALKVAFDHLQLADVLTTLCHEMFHDQVPDDLIRTVFDITFRHVELYVVPVDTTIGTLSLTAGIHFEAAITAWGLNGDARVEISYHDGITVHADIDPIELGVLALRGTGGAHKPALDFAITTGQLPTMLIEGEVELLGIKAATVVTLTDTHFTFDVTGSFYGFRCSLEVSGGHLGSSNGIAVAATMHDDLTAHLRDLVQGALAQAARDAASDIAAAKHDVDEWRDEVATLEETIEARRRTVAGERDETRHTMTNAKLAVANQRRSDVEELDRQISDRVQALVAQRAKDAQTLRDAEAQVASDERDVASLSSTASEQRLVVQGERDLATRRMDAAQAAVDAAQRNVDSIQQQINDNAAWWNRLPDTDWPWNKSKSRDWTWYGPMIAGLNVGYYTATGVLAAAHGVLEGIKQGAVWTPVELDPRVSGPLAAYYTATAALETAKEAVDVALQVQQGTPMELDPVLLTLRGAREVDAEALQVAVDALSVVQSGLELPPIDLDPEIVGLLASKATAETTLTIFEGVLDATGTTVAGALSVSDFIASNTLGGVFHITDATFAGAVDAVSNGSVHLHLVFEFVGDHHELDVGFDFGSLADSVEALVRQLLDLAA